MKDNPVVYGAFIKGEGWPSVGKVIAITQFNPPIRCTDKTRLVQNSNWEWTVVIEPGISNEGETEMKWNTEVIENNFTYHPPKGNQSSKYEALRANAKELAYLILELTPNSHEQTLAFTHLEQAIFYANAAIARNE